MPAIVDLISIFPRLEEVKPDVIAGWLGKDVNLKILENILANKLLYPTTIPTSEEELKIEVAMLTEAIKVDRDRFYNQNLNKIFIPDPLTSRFPNQEKLFWLFVDALNPEGIVNVALKVPNDGATSLATYIRPTVTANKGRVVITLEKSNFELQIGSLIVIPAHSRTVDIQFESDTATLMGKNQVVTEVLGGSLGVVIDTRLLKNG